MNEEKSKYRYDDEPVCLICNREVCLRSGKEHTGYCDECAQDRLGPLESERDALARFKAWVRAYLDAKGIPTHPDGPHGKEGCRIGDRMDLVFAEVTQLRKALKPFADIHNNGFDHNDAWHRMNFDSFCFQAADLLKESKRVE